MQVPARSAIRASLGCLLALAPACGSEDLEELPDAGTQARDSAGIRIIQNSPPDGSRLPWRIGPEPAVTIGRAEGDEPYLLYRAWDALRLADGRIVVLNDGTQELRVFDADGTHVATWGGAGDGPGEFRSLSAIEPWRGDSIAAWYGPRRGVTVLDANGNFGRNIVLEDGESEQLGMSFEPRATGRDGTILATQNPHLRGTVELQIRGPEGRMVASLGTHPGDARYIANEGTTRAMMYFPPFGARPIQVTWGDLFVQASTGSHEFLAYAGDGALARIVRLGAAPRVPTQAQIDAYIDEEVSWVSPSIPPGEVEQYRAQQRRGWEAVPVAENLPAFSSLVADRADHLWLEEFEPPGEERPGSLWKVLDPEGWALGVIETPDGLAILEIGADYILGRTQDEVGVEYVQLWSLERSPS